MYFRKYKKTEQRWYLAGYSVIADNVAKKLRWNTDNNAKPRLLWRYGLNQYNAGKYDQAIITFDRIESLIKDNKPLSKTIHLSLFYQYWARCYMFLFLTGKPQEKSYLEKAYEYYTKASKKIRKVESSIRVPLLLYETGRCLEFYGTLETAMDAYSKILSQHSTFRGYFITLFRTAVIGRYLASITTDQQTKNDTIDKCIDILLFLLESPPKQIIDIHLILLYARTLELSNDHQIKYRSISVYHSLFTQCHKRKYAKAHLFDYNKDEKLWLSTPETWMLLADMIEESYEYFIAREAFQKYIDELNKSLSETTNGDLRSILTIETCLELANRFIRYQNTSEAIKYADYALQMNHYHNETRLFLMKYSNKHQQIFLRERQAVSILRGLWKFRCWNLSYIKKLKEITIQQLEQSYTINRYDIITRDRLSYYCKDKYRALFAFEEECAVKIQHWWHRLIWKFQRQQKIRKKINLLASEILHNYQATQGKDPTIRENVIKISKHRFIGKKHPIHTIAQQLIQQTNAIWMIARSIKSYQLRKGIDHLIYTRKQKQYLIYESHVIKLQTRMRIFLSKRKILLARIRKLRQLRAVRKIEHLWGTYITTFSHIKHIRKVQKAKTAARLILRRKFLPYVRNFLKHRKDMVAYLLRKKEKILQRARDMKVSQEIVLAAIKIQRLFRHNFEKSWIFVCRKFLQERRKIQYSFYSLQAMDDIIKDDIKSYHQHRQQEDYLYSNPGVSIQSEEFRSLLTKRMVICPHSEMDVMDYQLLGTVLTQTHCKIQVLVLQSCKLFGQLVKPNTSSSSKEKGGSKQGPPPTANIAAAFNTHPSKELYAAQLPPMRAMSPPMSSPSRSSPATSSRPSKLIRLKNPTNTEVHQENKQQIAAATHYFEICKQFFQHMKESVSMRTLIIHGGVWSNDAITYVFRLIQVHNPRIQSLYLEHMLDKLLAGAIGRSTSLLLKDYFNYSIPGIRILSLHGCYLRDEDAMVISEGLAVNTSLEKFILSLNLLTDEGIVPIFQALSNNQKHIVKYVDLQYNLIRCQTALRRVMSSYRARKAVKDPLEINFTNNPILDGFDPIDYSVQTKIPPQFIVHYDEIALKKQVRERKALMKYYQNELQKPSARRQLLSVAKGLPDAVIPSTLHHTHGKEKNDRTSGLFSPQSYYTSPDANIIYYQTENFLQDLDTRIQTAGPPPLPLSNNAVMSFPAVSRKSKKGKKGGFGGITLPPLPNKIDMLQAYEPNMKIPKTAGLSQSLRSKISYKNEDIILSRSLKDFSTHRNFS